MPKIKEDGKSWFRRPKVNKGVVEPHKKKTRACLCGDYELKGWAIISNKISECGNEVQ